MPEEAADFDAIGEVLGIALEVLPAEKEVGKDNRARHDVKAVQARHSEVDAEEDLDPLLLEPPLDPEDRLPEE